MDKRELQRKEFLVSLISNPDSLNMLSNDRLKKILEYYEQEIEKKKNYLKTYYS